MMFKRYPIYDDNDLGRVSEYPLFNPNAPNSTGWVPPEYSGGGSSGGGSWHPPEIVTLDDPPFGPPQMAGNAPAPAPVPPVKFLPSSDQADDDAGFGTNTVVIGGLVILAAILLLKK